MVHSALALQSESTRPKPVRPLLRSAALPDTGSVDSMPKMLSVLEKSSLTIVVVCADMLRLPASNAEQVSRRKIGIRIVLFV